MVAVPLSLIINRSLQEGTVPAHCRTGNVTPIYKKGPKGNPGNYQPVSLTSEPSKLMESVLKGKSMEHLTRNKLIRASQHRFMPDKSCTSNLAVFLAKANKAVDDGKSVDIFYLDFAKSLWEPNWFPRDKSTSNK
jgi:hypothetical protein